MVPHPCQKRLLALCASNRVCCFADNAGLHTKSMGSTKISNTTPTPANNNKPSSPADSAAPPATIAISAITNKKAAKVKKPCLFGSVFKCAACISSFETQRHVMAPNGSRSVRPGGLLSCFNLFPNLLDAVVQSSEKLARTEVTP